MLDGLEQVPWRELHHAYGTAEDVPDLIRELATGDRERQEAALYELSGNIWHQGTVYEATSHAVPYLVEIALHPDTDPGTRDGVVGFLACVADGASYLDVHREFLEETVNEADVAQELRWVRKAHEAVRRRIPESLATLALNQDPSTQIAVAELLARFPEDAQELRPHVLRLVAAAENDPRRLILELALAALGSPVDREELLQRLPDGYYEAEDIEELRADLAESEDERVLYREILRNILGAAVAER